VLAAWAKPNNIALFTIAGILLHLFLRYLLNSSRIAWQAPLVAILIVGGVPLLVPLAQKLFAREFGSDHLAGISIITSVILGEYLVAAIVILMLSGGTALNNSLAAAPPRSLTRSPNECHKSPIGSVAPIYRR